MTVGLNSIPSVALQRTGSKMPLVGFGLWKVRAIDCRGNLLTIKVNRDTCADTVYSAIKSGYRLFDGAGDYGNEKEAGDGIQRAIKDGLVKREDLFITSKLWNTFHAKEHVKKLAKKQLADYGIQQFDLFLIHFPISLKYVDPAERYPPEWWIDGKVYTQNTPIAETWAAMEELVDEGLAKNIGISNFSGGLIIDLLRTARIPPAVLQIEHHPYLVQQPLLDLCKTLGIAITAYSSFGPQSFIELKSKTAEETPLLFDQDTIKSIAKAHAKTPAQVLLRWSTQRNIAVIPKSNNAGRLAQNLECCDFDLTSEQIASISSLNRNIRFNNPAEIDPRLAIFA